MSIISSPVTFLGPASSFSSRRFSSSQPERALETVSGVKDARGRRSRLKKKMEIGDDGGVVSLFFSLVHFFCM